MRFRWRRRIGALTMVVGLATTGVSAGGCSPSRSTSDRGAQPERSTSTSPVTSVATTTTVRAPLVVGSIGLTVDRAGRQIAVEVFYPAQQAGAGTPAASAGRPFPLIVFSPGFDIVPAVYDRLITGWASLGFVVAVAEYPFTAPGVPGGVNESDILQHPADLHATIDQLLTESHTAGSGLDGLIDPERIAVAGHSDGAEVTDAVVSNTCCRDSRIRAAAVMSGAELAGFGGSYEAARVPLLVTQGNLDTINPRGCSEQIYDTGGSPRFYLDLLGAGHLPPYTTDPSGVAFQGAVDRVTGLFWEAYLDGSRSALAALKSGREVGPDASWIVGPPVAEAGACPGAP